MTMTAETERSLQRVAPRLPGATKPSWEAFVINMPHAVERYAFMTDQLNRCAIPFRRIDAVDGRTLTFPMPGVSKWSYRLLHGRELHRSEVGCYLSHLKCIDAFLASDLPYCLILEDDAELGDNLRAVIDAAIAHHDDWDILRLSTVSSGKWFNVRDTGPCRLGVCFTRQKGSAAYVLNRRAAAVFRRTLSPMRLAYDIAFDLEYLVGLKALGADPLPVQQETHFQTQIQSGIRKLPPYRYLTVFPFRVFLETSRVVCRAILYARLRLKYAFQGNTLAINRLD